MVLLKGPLFSAKASGVFGKEVQYANTRRGTVVGAHRVPSQPRTQPQLATRRYMTFLSNQWAQLTAPELGTWPSPPGRRPLPAYNHFVKYNIDRFKHVVGNYLLPADDPAYPSAAWPATQATEPGGLASYDWSFTRTNVWLEYAASPFNDHWLTLFFYVPVGDPQATYARLMHIETAPDANVKRYHLPDALPDSWRLWLLRISRTGKPQDVRHNYWSFPV